MPRDDDLSTPRGMRSRPFYDPDAFGGPQVNVVECSSRAKSPTVNLARPGGVSGGGGGGRVAQNADKAAIDLQAYPVLTQDFSPAGLPSASTSWAFFEISQ